MRNILLIVFIFLFGFLSYFYIAKSYDNEPVVVAPKTEAPQEPQYDITSYTVEDGDVFATVMEKLGFDYSETMDILDSASSTYDFTKIKIGRPFRVFKDKTGKVVKLEYEKDTEEIVTVDMKDGSYTTTIVPIDYKIETDVISGTVSSSLWFAGLDAGMPEDLIVEFADIFAWTVDFSVQVQTGDTFTVLYEKRFRDGKYVGVGRVLAGKFVNGGKTYDGYLFKDKDGKPAYYSETGEALQKQFLKAPLEFKRITSGFTYARFDPITDQVGPHRAIDYAAAIGTPVMAVGDGVVVFAGWSSIGYGNFISIHHNDTYTTEYAHLSAFASGIRKGAKVVQGQVIGYVGSTGHSTGPHLHYQIKKNGTLVNPLEIELPPGDPVAEDQRAEFDKTVALLKKKLN